MRLLLNSPDESFYLRQIQRESGSALGAVQRELKLLVEMGIIRRNVAGARVYYRSNPQSAINNELRSILDKLATIAVADKTAARVSIPNQLLAQFSKVHHIRKLALFGSVLRDGFRPDSDIDVLVEFEEGYTSGFKMAGLESELSALIGRKVDLRTPEELNHYFREQVVRESEVRYDATR